MMLKVENLVKNYDQQEAVKGISFSVKPGEIYGFLGHNGAGKTTTIKMCTGLLSPSSGRVSICGYDVVKQPFEAKSNFGYVPDNPYLFQHLTGREFLELISDVYMKGRKDEAMSKIDELLDALQLSADADRLIGTYSLGMKRKISLCSAFLHDPAVVFLDEPMNGLDAFSAKAAKNLFRKYADQGCAILFTTHVLEVAERLCDRIGILHQGHLMAEGTFDQLKETYRYAGETLEDIFLNMIDTTEVQEDGHE